MALGGNQGVLVKREDPIRLHLGGGLAELVEGTGYAFVSCVADEDTLRAQAFGNLRHVPRRIVHHKDARDASARGYRLQVPLETFAFGIVCDDAADYHFADSLLDAQFGRAVHHLAQRLFLALPVSYFLVGEVVFVNEILRQEADSLVEASLALAAILPITRRH